jgi:hypothetical protein
MEVEDEDFVSRKPHMQGNEKEEWMEDFKVKTILISELQLTNKSLKDNYKSEESLMHPQAPCWTQLQV